MNLKICLPPIPLLLLSACMNSTTPASQSNQSDGSEPVTTLTKEKTSELVSIRSTFGSSDIINWWVIDSSSMVIETSSHRDLLARFSAPCPQILFTETIGLNTIGSFDQDKFNMIYLSGGHPVISKSWHPMSRKPPAQRQSKVLASDARVDLCPSLFAPPFLHLPQEKTYL